MHLEKAIKASPALVEKDYVFSIQLCSPIYRAKTSFVPCCQILPAAHFYQGASPISAPPTSPRYLAPSLLLLPTCAALKLIFEGPVQSLSAFIFPSDKVFFFSSRSAKGICSSCHLYPYRRNCDCISYYLCWLVILIWSGEDVSVTCHTRRACNCTSNYRLVLPLMKVQFNKTLRIQEFLYKDLSFFSFYCL